MLFKERHVGPIERGEKTQTRRFWKGRCARVGGVYAIKLRLFGPGSEPVGWIRVTGIRSEFVNDISEADARAEGGYTKGEFLEALADVDRRRHWPYDYTRVTVVTFEYVGRERPRGDT
jgi:hypothetical protein